MATAITSSSQTVEPQPQQPPSTPSSMIAVMELDVPASHSKIVENEDTGECHPLREYRSLTLSIGGVGSTSSTSSSSSEKGDDNKPSQQEQHEQQHELRCLLIQDRRTEKAAISTSVYPAGQLHDGLDWPGRAHLLEHLVFLGSTEFPNENDLSYYLTQNGGNSNAYTDLELTCYYMDCRTAALEGMIQRWVAALREPLLHPNVVEREIMAVDSEHAKNKPEDMWRLYQLSKTLLASANDNDRKNHHDDHHKSPLPHPYGQFGSGCLASLLPDSIPTTNSNDNGNKDKNDNTVVAGTTTTTTSTTTPESSESVAAQQEDQANQTTTTTTTMTNDPKKEARIAALRDAVQEFWDLHYIASNITVTVLSSHSLDDQEALIRKHFTSLLTDRHTSKITRSIPHVPPLIPLSLQKQQPMNVITTTTAPAAATTTTTIDTGTIGCRCVEVVPIRPVYTLELHWPLRETLSLYQSKPTRVLAHLLGDEGPGSLLHVLRHERPWVQELSADDGSRATSAFSVFVLQLELTQAGWHHVNDIVALVYVYIRLLTKVVLLPHEDQNNNKDVTTMSSSSSLLPAYIYQELKVMGDMQFEFLGIPSSAVDTVSSLSVQMHHIHNPKEYLSGSYKFLTEDWDQTFFQTEFIRYLIPENMLMIVGAPDYATQAAATTTPTTSSSSNEGAVMDDSVTTSATTTTTMTNVWESAPWYGTQYRVTNVDAKIIETWKNLTRHNDTMVQELATHLHLPPANEFLPSNFDLIQLPESVMTQFFSKKESPPVCIQNDENVQLWYKPDTAFSMPKVNIFISFPIIGSESSMDTTSLLWTDWQNEVCNVFAYAASMAGLYGEWVANSKRSTIELQVSGYSHKAALFCKRLLETTVASTKGMAMELQKTNDQPAPVVVDDVNTTTTMLDEELWDRLVQKLRDQYQSFLMGQVYQHAIYSLDQCLEAVPTPRTIEERMEELNRITVQDLIRFHHQQFLTTGGGGGGGGGGSTGTIQIMVHGNLTPEQAKDLGKAIPQILRQSKPKDDTVLVTDETPGGHVTPISRTKATTRTLQQRIVQLPPETHFVFQSRTWNEENTNHCSAQYFSFGIMDLATNASLALLRHLISERAYYQLRTQEQLGYIVHSQLKTLGDHVKGILLLVQGEAHDPVHMESRMRHFWQTVRTELVNISAEEFETNRQALYESFMERKKNLMQESAAHWNVITNQTFHFTRVPEIASFVQTRTKQDVLRLLDKGILYGSSLTIEMFGHGMELPNVVDLSSKENTTTTATTTVPNLDCDTVTAHAPVYISDPLEFGRVQSLFPLPPTVPVEVVKLE